jgi:hypothetical protein
MATIDELALKNIGLWWRYGISRHWHEWKYIIIGRIFESEIILIPPSLKISESSSNGSYRNTDEVWWRYGISRSCNECIDRFIRGENRRRKGLELFELQALQQNVKSLKIIDLRVRHIKVWKLMFRRRHNSRRRYILMILLYIPALV